MDPKLWSRISDAFSFVISRGIDDAPNALLQACKDDDELLLHVRPLVEEHFRISKAAPETSLQELPAMLGNRFRVKTRLGGGTFGDVYRVSDETSEGNDLALKVLRDPDPLALYYFKREFRTLADVYHRNIIKLRELVCYQDRWMFTMEFIDGVNLVQFVDAQAQDKREVALGSCLLQLAEGLVVLHRKGLLHRDVKPSNVLVGGDGRVVLLDFGLARSFDDSSQSFVTFAGTPAYMSPEIASGAPAAEPCDWYAFGVLFYRSLTGRLPFQGNFVELLRRKQVEAPIPPAVLVPSMPAKWNALCLRLLERNPVKRASYDEVVELLRPGVQVPVQEPPRPKIIGRNLPLQQLADAVWAAEDRAALIHLCGPSGIGKTALLREFVSRSSGDCSLLVFAGRCYEGETVPYQALDDLIDHIGQYLRRLPSDRVEALLPRNFGVLAKMFPVLAPFLPNDGRSIANFNATELRTRGLAALRELLGRLRERHRIVLIIDDLQWGDLDGCLTLSDLFSSAEAPAVAAVLAYRSEDVSSSVPFKALRDLGRLPANLAVTTIDLGYLEDGECRQLARSLIAEPATQDTLVRIAEQSGGNPFFIQEIARWINAHGATDALAGGFSLIDVLRSRIEELGAESRLFLELVAVAGQPTDVSMLKRASGIADALATRDELIASRLVRSRIVRDHEEVEIYHDRIRAAVLTGISPDLMTQRHAELARVLESAGTEPERIAGHYEQARNPHLCAKYALIAAGRACDVLAFNEAARYFEMAISSGALDSDGVRTTHFECAEALAKAGRGHDAAGHYIAACDGATTDEQLEWNLRAGEELLYSGHVDQGLEIFRAVLTQVGVKVPSRRSALPFALLARRAHLSTRGLRWRKRNANEIRRDVLLKVDTCSAVAIGLALIDVLQGAALQTASLTLALQAGEPRRIARALAMEAGYRSTGGAKTEKQSHGLLRRARDLADQTADSKAIGLANVMAAACAWTSGRWQNCYTLAAAAREALRERRDSVTWERDTAAIFEVESLRWMGRWRVMKDILPELVEDARHRGDLYAGSILQMHGGSCAALADDNPEKALAGLKILERWSNTGFHVEHLVEMHNQVEIALYAGEPVRAVELAKQRWQELEKSFLLTVQTFKIQMHSLRGRAALAAAWVESSKPAREAFLKLARRDLLVIRRERTTWGTGTSELIEASIQLLSGKRTEAITSFGQAEALFDAGGMRLHSAVARRARGLLLADEAGRELIEAAEADLSAEGIANLERFSAVVAPGRYSF